MNNGDLFDDQAQSIDQETITLQNDDDENEAEWRRIRYEREQVLKKQMNESDSVWFISHKIYAFYYGIYSTYVFHANFY